MSSYAGLEAFFIALLVAATLAILGFAAFAVYKLFAGQR